MATVSNPAADAEAYVCPICLGSLGPSLDRADVWVCMNCEALSPLWYLRLMGIHECERDEQTTAYERLHALPVVDVDPVTLRPLREWGRSRNLDDYAEVRAMLASGYVWLDDAGTEMTVAQYDYLRREQ